MDRRILLVGPQAARLEPAREALVREGLPVALAGTGREAAARALRDGPPTVVVAWIDARSGDPEEAIEELARAHPESERLVLVDDDGLKAAVGHSTNGSLDYLRVPCGPLEIVHGVRRALRRRQLLHENDVLRGLLQAHESARMLGGCLETADVLPITLDILLRVLDGRARAVARLVEAAPRELDGIYIRGFPEGRQAELRADIEGGKLFDVGELDRAAIGGPPGLHTALDQRGLAVESLMCLPLRAEGRMLGGIWVFGDDRPFDDEDLRRAELVVAQAEQALVNAGRYSQATEKAFVDDVTTLYNARYLLLALDREIQRASRADMELSVLFVDLDRFKLVNDQYGHLVGSQVLRELGGLLQDSIRTVDTVGRYGGDEFTLLLVDTGLDGARQVAERIRETVAGHPFGGDHGLSLELTLSIGVATYPHHGDERERLLDLADKAMYLGKALGRNHVCTADDLSDRREG